MSTAVCKISQKKLKFEDVLCPICREIYIEPIALPCKHTVCLQCLEKTVENNRLVCPICRTRIGTFIRLAKSLKKIVDQGFWQKLKYQFPLEIQKKLNGEEDGMEKEVMGTTVPPVLADQGSIKEEFDEMFHKLKIEEERSRRAEQIASETLVKKLMAEEFEKEKQRKLKSQEIVKSDVLYIKSLIMSENGQRESFNRIDEGDVSTSSSVSNDHDSISDELRHFTPICIAPKTPPKLLPNGKHRDAILIKPINLSSSLQSLSSRGRFRTLKNKMPLKVLSNNFLRTKPPPHEDMDMDEEVNQINSEINISNSDLNSNITDQLPPEIIKEQELIQQRIKQEQEDLAIAIKLHNKWNKEKCRVKRNHGYQLRSAKRCRSKT